MEFRSRKFNTSFVVHRRRVIWTALILLLAGGAVYSFNPSAIDGQQLRKGEQIMKGQLEGQANENTGSGSGAAPPETETATFALG
jgi:hypothetical protein